MEPVISISHPAKKSRTEDDFPESCLICDSGDYSKRSDFIRGTVQGLNKIQASLEKRRNLQSVDTEFGDCITHIESRIGRTCLSDATFWHKKCYSQFTHQGHIDRLEKKLQKTNQPKECYDAKQQEDISSQGARVSMRSTIPRVNWQLCIFCQKRNDSKRLCQVLTFESSKCIHNLAQYNQELKCRIGAEDLIAVEAHYHPSCRRSQESAIKFEYDVELSGTSENCTTKNDILSNLTAEVDKGFSCGHIYSITDISSRYSELIEERTGENVSIRNNEMKVILQDIYGSKIHFQRQICRNLPVLVFPRKITTMEVVEVLMAQDRSDGVKLQEIMSDTRNIFYAAKKIKSDLELHPGIEDCNMLTTEAGRQCVPDSLYTFLRVLLSDDDDDDDNALVGETVESELNNRIILLGQDILYASSKGKKMTPKHISTGLLTHQATRSKQLVNILHAAGSSVSYDIVRRIDTSIAEKTLKRFMENSVVVPENLAPNRFVHYAADNIDILEDTLDGRQTFHATQVVAFQEGPPRLTDSPLILGRNNSLKSVPGCFSKLSQSKISASTKYTVPPKQINFSVTERNTLLPPIKDLIWLTTRNCLQNDTDCVIPSWTAFNQCISEDGKPRTTVGYCPIIPNPAHEYDTLWTVITRCKMISDHLKQDYTVITFDEALYSKVKILMWLRPDETHNVIPLLGGFHSIQVYLTAIGEQYAGSGLEDCWIESELVSDKTASAIMKGKHYNRCVRTHKITFEALWKALMSSFRVWLSNKNQDVDLDRIDELTADIYEDFKCKHFNKVSSHSEGLSGYLQDMVVQLFAFIEENSSNNTFRFWLLYLELIAILLNFIRASREGNWTEYVTSFKEMLKLMAFHDHVNYMRWGSAFLIDMENLEKDFPAVYKEFLKGAFSIKTTEQSFVRIPADQAIEHVNKVCKTSGGLINITTREATRQRWELTYNERGRLSDMAKDMFNISTQSQYIHNEIQEKRLRKDVEDVLHLQEQFERFKVFSSPQESLICISTGDVVPIEHAEKLIQARVIGGEIIHDFIHVRFGPDSREPLHSPIKKANMKTFKDISISSSAVKQKSTMKIDTMIQQRLLAAVSSSRPVDICKILKHELASIPPSIGRPDGSLNPANKAPLSHILTEGNFIDTIPANPGKSALIVDAMSVVQRLGIPKNAKTFGDLAYVYFKYLTNNKNYRRIDVVFDRYVNKPTIKDSTRSRRFSQQKHGSIRRIIRDNNTPLPPKWGQFINNSENKSHLIEFLAKQFILLAQAHSDIEVIVGGLPEGNALHSSDKDISMLYTEQDEADTLLILHSLHALQNGYSTLVIQSDDTDVLVLLIWHDLAQNIWMQRSTPTRYVNVHEIALKLGPDVKNSLLGFHSVTGCDTVSQFRAVGKKTAWKIFTQQPHLLKDIGLSSDVPLQNVEEFVCKLYSPSTTVTSVDKLRVHLFHKGKPLHRLPPTSDTLKLHVQRANYQSLVWATAVEQHPSLPLATDCGWKLEDGTLKPIFMTREPSPMDYLKITSCRCLKKLCDSLCSCKLAELSCIPACSCFGKQCLNPFQIASEGSTSDEEEF